MTNIEVSEVKSRRERDAFIKFPWQIYADDPAWVPPLIIERKGFLNRRKHPFYRHGDAALFLARKNGEIVGRIMTSDDPNYNSLHQTNVGCFGLFESIADREVAASLFEAATNWLRKKGRTEIMGPIDYSINYVCGLLIDGFQFPPTIMTAHNPSYYRELDRGLRFYQSQRLVRVVVCRSVEGRTAIATAGNARSKTLARQDSPGKFERPARREQTASRNF